MTTQPSTIRAALHEHFGFSEFKEGQEAAVQHVVDGHDAVVIMPTGSGKSLCYQLASLVMDGVTFVISPLIALMKDQVDGLEAHGIPATFINSSLSAGEMTSRIRGLIAGEYKLVYVAPERFRNRRFMASLEDVEIAMMAVDEAHCISQWGHDFRPDYLRLKEVLKEWPDARLMALTATATPHVRNDIIAQLGLGVEGRQEPVVMVHGFARNNLHLAVTRAARHADKFDRIHAVLEKYPSGIIYCSTRKGTERVFTNLKARGVASGIYHAGLTDKEREAVQNRFMNKEIPVVVATNAFGMGVDRDDLRCVIHWDIPGSLEAYYQEVGRAGRDGKPSWCELLYNYADVRTQEFFIEGSNPTRMQVLEALTVIQARCSQGPVKQSIEEWTALMPTLNNEMNVRTIFGILERTALIERSMEAGDRIYTTEIVAGADESALSEQFEALDKKRYADEQKLKDMISYASATRCRHAFILDYFGDPEKEATCTCCDRCVRGGRDNLRGPETEEEWILLQKILSCVARMQGRFGVARVIQVLQGSKSKPVLQFHLNELSTYGLLAGHTEAVLRKYMEELIADGSVAISDGEYPLALITNRGLKVLKRAETPMLVWPEPKGLPAIKRRGKSVDTAKSAPGNSLVDDELVGRLKAWRSQTAREKGIPPYLVMKNETMNALAVVLPRSEAELESVRGIGPATANKYADEILEILDTWIDEQERKK